MKSNETKKNKTSPPKPRKSWGVGNLENIGNMTAEEYQKIIEETKACEAAGNPHKVKFNWVDD